MELINENQKIIPEAATEEEDATEETGEEVTEESVEGFAGQACQELTEKLEEALGSVLKREPTAESYLSNEIQAQKTSTEQFL